MVKFLFYSLVGLLILQGCSSKIDYSNKIEALEQHLVKLNKADSTFKMLYHDSIKKQVAYIDVNLRFINENFKDTLYGAAARKFFELSKLSQEGIQNYRKHYNVVDNELPFTMEQIQLLIQDLKAGEVDTLKAAMFFETEVKNALFLTEATLKIQEEFQTFPDKFYSQKPFLDSLRDATEKIKYAL